MKFKCKYFSVNSSKNRAVELKEFEVFPIKIFWPNSGYLRCNRTRKVLGIVRLNCFRIFAA